MASNSFGDLFRFTSWGESHGPAIGVVIDGCPPRLPLCEDDFRAALQRRKTGQSAHVSQRKETDEVRILSGVFEGQTTGTPIHLFIENGDMRSKDYDAIKDTFRPGHADYTYQAKYGIRDYRGGGRSSARETAARVMAGVVASKILGPSVLIRGAMVQMGPHKINRAAWDWDQIAANPFSCPDAAMAAQWEEYLDGIRKAGLSTGAVLEIVASGVPVGWGDPIYDKLDARLASAMMSINAVKAVEIGDGFAAASLTGDQNADDMRAGEGEGAAPVFLSNHAGGILGGISTGQDVIVRFAVKPTSSILVPRQTIDRFGANTTVATKGRHDPCVGIRAVPVGEAMMACVLADAMLKQKTLGGTAP